MDPHPTLSGEEHDHASMHKQIVRVVPFLQHDCRVGPGRGLNQPGRLLHGGRSGTEPWNCRIRLRGPEMAGCLVTAEAEWFKRLHFTGTDSPHVPRFVLDGTPPGMAGETAYRRVHTRCGSALG